MNPTLDQTRNWLHRQARALDIALFAHLFEQEDQLSVVEELAYYQNPDGGFGHGLEPDFWNPASSPIATWKATDYLRRINFYQTDHPVVARLIQYVKETQEKDGRWPAVISSNNDTPHAFWWHYQNEETAYWGYNPTAALAGFLYRTGDKTQTAVISSLWQDLLQRSEADMHELPLFLNLYHDLAESGWDKQELKAGYDKLIELLHAAFQNGDWNNYVLRPSTVFAGENQVFQAPFQAMIEKEQTYLRETRLADGTWPIPWNWNQYPEAFHVSVQWWKGYQMILHELFLQTDRSKS